MLATISSSPWAELLLTVVLAVLLFLLGVFAVIKLGTWAAAVDSPAFVANPRAIAALEEMRIKLRAPTQADVVRRSLTLLQLATNNAVEDGQLLLRDKNGVEREIILR